MTTTQKYVLRNLRIGELSGVDVPAQEHATTAITKSMSLIKTVTRAETSATPTSKEQPAVTDAEKQALEAKNADLAKSHADLAKSHADLTKSHARLSVLAKLSDEEKLYLDRLSDEDQEAVLAKGFAGARGVLRTAIEADAPVYTAADGTVYRKSYDQTIVALVKRNDELATMLAKQMIATQNVEIEKQAVVVMKNFACEVPVKVAIMKAIEGISDEKVRVEAAQAILRADGALGLGLTRQSDPGAAAPLGSPEAQIDQLAKAHQKANPKLSIEQAYGHVITHDPVGRALFAQTVES